jgi:hypothetical protein
MAAASEELLFTKESDMSVSKAIAAAALVGGLTLFGAAGCNNDGRGAGGDARPATLDGSGGSGGASRGSDMSGSGTSGTGNMNRGNGTGGAGTPGGGDMGGGAGGPNPTGGMGGGGSGGGSGASGGAGGTGGAGGRLDRWHRHGRRGPVSIGLLRKSCSTRRQALPHHPVRRACRRFARPRNRLGSRNAE